jgi:enoyl-CoA hydratase/carnithine racemase
MNDMSSVIREKRGQAFWITINRPDKRNAINADVGRRHRPRLSRSA